MANKYQLINEMASETLKEITQNGESWIKFLNTASNNYKYSFNEQVLIYAQKPNATACADIETWNKKLRRWVNKGAKGIALLSMENGRNVLRHVFDISDTHSGINKDFKLWEIKPSYENGIIETLENSFGNLEVKSNLAEAIYSASINLVEDNYQDYLVDLKEVLDGSLLEGMQDIDLEGNFIVLLAKSISYMAMKRCGIDPTEHFNVSDFEMISSFNNKRVVSRLGAAISDIAEQELREIYSSVINYEKNYKLTNRTFVNNEKINYHNNEEKNNEGRNDYDRINIQSNGRLPNTTSSITKNEENGTGEILKNEGEIPKRTQKRVIRGINVRWQDGRTFRRNRTNSSKENETDNNKSSREEPNNRGNEKRESNELGTSNELNKEPSRRNDNVRANLQLNLFEDTYVPPIKELPSVDTQINNIQAQAEVENTPAFSFTQEIIDKTLIEGSNFSHSKYRIYEQFKRSLSAKENIIFLKHEYGIGGSSSAYSGADFGQEHDSKGIKLYKGYKDDRVELLINWSNVEQRLKEIIRLDRYFNDEEKIKYQEWLENDYEKEKWMLDRGLKENTNDFIDISSINIEKNYKLSNGNYFHFHTNDEGYYYAIYDKYGVEQDGGLLEYSDNVENQTLMGIRKRLAEFTDIEELTNENLEEVSQDFIDNLEEETDKIIRKSEFANPEDYEAYFVIDDIKNMEEDKSYTVARVINNKNCVELHYTDGIATIEYGTKQDDNSWESIIEEILWFDKNQSKDEIISKLEELFDVLHTIITSRRADECLKLIKKHIDDPGAWMKWVFDQGNLKEGYKILDAGCGFGNLWRYNENRLPVDLDVTLVDYHNTNADELEKYVADKPQFKFLWGDMNELELGADYQIIFANHVIGYMESPKDTYGKLKSCLAMEGKLITTWAGLNDREQVANLFCSYFPKEERKLQDFLIEKKQTIKDRERVLNEVFDHVELRKYPFVLAVSTKEGMLEHLARWAESMGISPSADLNRLAEELISEKPYEINCDNYLYVCS